MIVKRAAILDAERLGLSETFFIAIRTNQHNADWLAGFAAVIDEFDEVVEFYRMSGDIDYLMRVVVPLDVAQRGCIHQIQRSWSVSPFGDRRQKFGSLSGAPRQIQRVAMRLEQVI